MLLYVATNFCPTTAHCRNFFALLRYDEQPKLLVEIDGVSARRSSTLTIANASTNSSSFGCCFCCALVPSSCACHWQSTQQVLLRRGRKLRLRMRRGQKCCRFDMTTPDVHATGDLGVYTTPSHYATVNQWPRRPQKARRRASSLPNAPRY